jgi:hypothetical protein
VQLDGGIERSIARVQKWFEGLPASPPDDTGRLTLGALTVGLTSAVPPGPEVAALLADLASAVLADGGTVLIPEGDPVVADGRFRRVVLGDTPPRATLAYGQPVEEAGLHLVETDTDHWVENVTGLAACGAHLVVGAVGDGPQQGHPLIPVLQVAGPSARETLSEDDVDLIAGSGDDPDRLRALVLATVRHDYTPASQAGGFVDLQLTRGLLGVST